jgi:hypothetical protein
MRAALIAASLALATTAGAQSRLDRPHPAQCAKPGSDKAATARPKGPQKLGEMPPAQQVLAVYRTDHRGCPQLVVVRSGIGNR